MRRQLIEDALGAHREGKYRLSIPALLPHLEGIITDWIFTQLPEDNVPWGTESKTKRFRDLVLDKPPTVSTYERIVSSVIDFIVDGPVLQTFRRWLDQIERAFPNRHVVEHGRYDDSLFDQEKFYQTFPLVRYSVLHLVKQGPQREPACTLMLASLLCLCPQSCH